MDFHKLFTELIVLVWQFLSKLNSSQCAGAEVEKIKISLHSKNVTSSNVTVNLVRSNQRFQGKKNRVDTDSAGNLHSNLDALDFNALLSNDG